MVLLAPAQASPDPVTITKHANLGFSTSVPVDADTGVASPPCLLEVGFCLFRGAVAFHGTLTANLNTPNGPLPVSVKYTPIPNGSTVSYSLSGDITFNFGGCTNCPATLPFTASSAPNTFTAPMNAD